MKVSMPTENQDCEPSQTFEPSNQVEGGTTLQDEEILESSKAIDHTPKKWKSINEIMAQCNMCIMEPENFEEADLDESWRKAMEVELEMIEKNNTWQLVERPFNKPVIGVNADFKKSSSEATLYVKTSENSGVIIVSLYVDDIVYTGNSPQMLEEFRKDMMKHYEMTDLGLLHHFLGMGILQTEKSIFIHQKKYAQKLIEKFGLKDCKAVATPLAMNERLSKIDGSEAANEGEYRQIVGSLLY
ncbi:hypothetical protein L3X38_016762 [Prunus dulcis]|uniref:Reverse transcriptase Ty1/copia-type domain-containing protein n=1 Tax=Prunus dulcis TaxID=3755 RepID=A0AAD4Z9F1_PRUDU|nr:hypothetical protein L3X38_016762 [Prunus dulcis]